jgi:putative transcriptional regulator
MTRKAFDLIRKGLEDALAHARGDASRGRVRRVEVTPVEIRKTRTRLGLSQEKFAEAFGVPISTIRKWEQGDRAPTGPAQILLQVIQEFPEKVDWARRLAGARTKSERKSIMRDEIERARTALCDDSGRLGPWESDELDHASAALNAGMERLAVACINKAYEIHQLDPSDYNSGYTFMRRPDAIARLRQWRKSAA